MQFLSYSYVILMLFARWCVGTTVAENFLVIGPVDHIVDSRYHVTKKLFLRNANINFLRRTLLTKGFSHENLSGWSM